MLLVVLALGGIVWAQNALLINGATTFTKLTEHKLITSRWDRVQALNR